MSAVASSAGVISATAPGGVPVTAPWSDAFTRANGAAGQPWYRPGCHDELQIVSNTLQATIANDQISGLLLAGDDFDLTFDVNYSAASTGVRDDINVAFRLDACAPSMAAGVPSPNGSGLLLATNPGASGTAGMTLLSESGGSFSSVFTGGTGIVEGGSYTYRLHLVGTALDVYVNGGTPYFSATVSAFAGQRALQFFITRPGTSIDNVTLA